jgi:hypothetical protein
MLTLLDQERSSSPLSSSRPEPINNKSRTANPMLPRPSVPKLEYRSKPDPASNSRSPSPRLMDSLPQTGC